MLWDDLINLLPRRGIISAREMFQLSEIYSNELVALYRRDRCSQYNRSNSGQDYCSRVERKAAEAEDDEER